jgi:hypothetical protein
VVVLLSFSINRPIIVIIRRCAIVTAKIQVKLFLTL